LFYGGHFLYASIQDVDFHFFDGGVCWKPVGFVGYFEIRPEIDHLS
jgi:hypothetical protein